MTTSDKYDKIGKSIKHFDDPDIERYNNELMDDTRLTNGNIRDKSMMMSQIRSKWLNYYHYEKNLLIKLEDAKKKYMMKNSKQTKISDSVVLRSVEKTIETTDEKAIRLNEMITNTKDRINFLENARDILKEMSFNIKNSIELLKMESV